MSGVGELILASSSRYQRTPIRTSLLHDWRVVNELYCNFLISVTLFCYVTDSVEQYSF